MALINSPTVKDKQQSQHSQSLLLPSIVITTVFTYIKQFITFIYTIVLNESSSTNNLILTRDFHEPSSIKNITSTEKNLHHQQIQQQSESSLQEQNLFPSISSNNNNNNNSESLFGNEPKLSNYTPTTCSMGLTTRLIPVKNQNGELEWVFTEDDSKLGNNTKESEETKNSTQDSKKNYLSPTISNESTSTRETLNNTTPPTEDDEVISVGDHDLEENDNDNDGEDKVHQCPHCDASFKIRGYLTRHLKKHSTKKAYSCPYHNKSIYIDDNNITHKCHPSGGFSRRDTYKTHLKSRHFKYPKGTKTKDRANCQGTCSMCGEFFNSAEIWCEMHVEGGECKHLPVGYKGKSRIKNRLRKQLQKNKQVDPELLPYASKVLQEVKELKQQQQQKRNNTSNNKTPSITSSQISSQESINTPSSIISTSSASTYESSPYTPQSSKSPLEYVMKPQVQIQHPLQQHYSTGASTNAPSYTFDQISSAHHQIQPNHQNSDDYDDDYCLDTDQIVRTDHQSSTQQPHIYFNDFSHSQPQQPPQNSSYQMYY